jgi:hypothetical protein
MPAPVFQPTPISNGIDSHVYAELDRLNSAIEQLQKSAAPPDTRRAWGAPRVSGRLFVDSINFANQNTESRLGNGNMQNVTGFREARIGVAGSGYSSFDYRVEVGFHQDAGRVALIDNWIGAKNIPLLGYVRAGHFKPETGQYYVMGSTNISMMEYTGAANIFGLGRRIGISSENLFAQDRVRLFFGYFHNEATDMNRRSIGDNQGQVVNLRLSAAPWFAQEGKYVFHIGGNWQYVTPHTKNR